MGGWRSGRPRLATAPSGSARTGYAVGGLTGGRGCEVSYSWLTHRYGGGHVVRRRLAAVGIHPRSKANLKVKVLDFAQLSGLIRIGSGAGGSSLGSPGTSRGLNSSRSSVVVVQRPSVVQPVTAGVELPGPRLAAAAGPASGAEPDLTLATPRSQGGHARGGLRSIRSSAIRSGRPAIPRRCSAASMSSCLG